jgi:hypothetical protein
MIQALRSAVQSLHTELAAEQEKREHVAVQQLHLQPAGTLLCRRLYHCT